jgi:hypothetical protein
VATGAEAICSGAEVHHKKGKVVCVNCSVASGAEAICSRAGVYHEKGKVVCVRTARWPLVPKLEVLGLERLLGSGK